MKLSLKNHDVRNKKLRNLFIYVVSTVLVLIYIDQYTKFLRRRVWSVESLPFHPATRVRFPAGSGISISILRLGVYPLFVICTALSLAVALTTQHIPMSNQSFSRSVVIGPTLSRLSRIYQYHFTKVYLT